MAMNKKEAAEFEAMKKAVIVARALNWSEPVARDVAIPKYEETTGYTFNSRNGAILYARSSPVSHATSYEEMPKRTSTQRPLELYSTKLLALRALRYAVEKECAEKLANIDIQIQQEMRDG